MSQCSLKANISQTVHPIHTMSISLSRVFGVGRSNGAISGSIIAKMAADGHLGMMALSHVTLAMKVYGVGCVFVGTK